MTYLSRINLRVTVISVSVILGATLLFSGYYLWSINRQYDRARDQADVVRSRFQADDGSAQVADLPQLTQDLVQLEEDLHGLDDRVNVPVIGGIVRNAPIVGERVKASQQLLDLGIELTGISREASEIANEVRVAFEANGFMDSGPVTGPTWLEVVESHRDDINDLERRYETAIESRASLDVEVLPGRALNTLDTLDGMLERATGLRDDYFHLFPLLGQAFGSEEEAHYLVLLQNGQELRQAGGFPGTYAAITIANGRITNLEIQPIGYLNAAYADARPEVLPAPGPIARYLLQEHWLPHDAGWSPDFPLVAETLFEMYDLTGWPPINGVVALNDGAVELVLEAIGPYDVEIEGETLRVDSANFLDLIQSFRDEGLHKDVVGILGNSLIEQVKAADFDTKKEIFFLLRDAADQREVQVALRDPDMQDEVVSRGWDGAIYPDPDIPTLSLTLANVTGNKTSDNVYVDTVLELTQPDAGSPVHARWSITFANHGDLDGDPEFEGFHRTWAQVYLPPGATLTATSQDPESPELVGDDRALGFHIPLEADTEETLVLEFDLPPDAAALLIRRPSGMNDIAMDIQATTATCDFTASYDLTEDDVIDLTGCESVWHREYGS